MTHPDLYPESADDIIVAPGVPIIKAVEVLAEAHKRIVLVADDRRRLLGILTDADIRYALLKKVDFQAPVEDIMVTDPVTVRASMAASDVLRLMEHHQCYEIPVLDEDDRIVGVHLIDKLLNQAPGRRRGGIAVIMAGGLGTRLRPLTDSTPKPLIPVGDKPILFILMDRLLEAEFSTIHITLNYKGEAIREAIAREPRFDGAVSFIEEGEPLGTAGALSLIPERPDESFLVINGDLLTGVAMKELLHLHAFEDNAVTVALKEQRDQSQYGVAELEGTRIVRIEEKPVRTEFINTGLYAVHPSVLDHIPKDRFMNMTDVVDKLLAANARVGGFPVHEYWLDIGEPKSLKKANEDFPKFFDKPD